MRIMGQIANVKCAAVNSPKAWTSNPFIDLTLLAFRKSVFSIAFFRMKNQALIIIQVC